MSFGNDIILFYIYVIVGRVFVYVNVTWYKPESRFTYYYIGPRDHYVNYGRLPGGETNDSVKNDIKCNKEWRA
jgi:hypothetical protein